MLHCVYKTLIDLYPNNQIPNNKIYGKEKSPIKTKYKTSN